MEQNSAQIIPGSSNLEEQDAEVSLSTDGPKSFQYRPGKYYPSQLTRETHYDHKNLKTGIAIIINQTHYEDNSPRHGAKKDSEVLKAVLVGQGFEVRLFEDLKKAEIEDILKKVSQEDHLKNVCFMCFIMSHSGCFGKIFASDNEYFMETIWENFIGRNCMSLIGKPKLFFIQACRSEVVNSRILHIKTNAKPVYDDDVRTIAEDDDRFVIPTTADLLIMFSTSEGYYSFKNPNKGTCFIQALAKELSENSHEELMTILTKVNNQMDLAYKSRTPKDKMDPKTQIPIISSTLTKSLFFTKIENN